MQPTLLVKSKKSSQVTDFSNCREKSESKWQGFVQPLKSAGWAAAFGSIFIITQSYALSLQNIQINSALGEPLDAIVMVNAAPGEVLQASCMRTGSNTNSDMPAIRGIRLSLSRQISPGTLRLTTRRPITEPMSEVVVHIECPGAPSVKRSFLVMLDPRGATLAATPVPYTQNLDANSARTSSVPLVSSSNDRVSVRSRQVIVSRGTPVDPGSDYVVANGDALSTIAARITGRDYGTVWSWAATIQSANPHAFINGNPNELVAGSKLYIPGTLAAGTAGLTVPRATAKTATASRYSDSFSTRTTNATTRVAVSPEELRTGQPALSEPKPGSIAQPVAVLTQSPVAPSGSVRAIQPVMVMATSFSSVSRDRLRQRNRGLIQAAPDNLPDFVGGGTAANAAASTISASNTDKGQPSPEKAQTPEIAVATKPAAATAPINGNRISFLGILGGLGLLAGAFFTGWWLSRRRAEAEMQENLEALRNEERYRERVRSGRQQAIREGLKTGSAGAGMMVTETPPEPTLKPSAFTEEDLDKVVEAALGDELESPLSDSVEPAPTLSDVPMIDPFDLEFNTEQDHELADIDLELLERDYAAQTDTNTNLEDIAIAGQGNKPADETLLDMEFPEEVKMRGESEPAFDSLEFDPRAEPLDFDIGAGGSNDDSDKTEALGLDLEEASASIDAHLEQLRIEDSEQVDLDHTSEIDMNPTEHFEVDELTEHEITDLVVDNLLGDGEVDASAHDVEDFYHLEASSIMSVGKLDFEKGPDDETNILRFRQRSIRTGTDDSTSEDD